MSRLLELLESGVLVQGIVTLICIGVIAYLYTIGKEVPDTLVNIVLIILGFWFGSKGKADTERSTEQIVTAMRGK